MGKDRRLHEFVIEDDAGAACRLDWTGAPTATPEDRAISRQAVTLLEGRGEAGISAPALLMGVCTAAFMALVGFFRLPLMLVLAVAGAVGLCFPVLFRLRLKRQLAGNRDRIVGFLSGRGRCPGCMYDLMAIAGENNGMITCPECGGAWRRERLPSRGAAVADRRGVDEPPAEAVVGRTAMEELTRPRSHSQVNDDRGAPTRLLVTSWREAKALALDDGHAERIEKLRRATRPLGRVRRWLLIGVLGIFLVVVVTGVVPTIIGRGSLLQLVPMAVLPLVSCFFIVRLARGTSFASGKRIKELALERGVCPACLAELGDREPEEDGCRVCGVCAAAWRMDDGAANGSREHS